MSGSLRREDGFAGRGDDAYAMLVGAHAGLDEAMSLKLNAALVLLLANHAGNLDILREAIDAARATLDPRPDAR